MTEFLLLLLLDLFGSLGEDVHEALEGHFVDVEGL